MSRQRVGVTRLSGATLDATNYHLLSGHLPEFRRALNWIMQPHLPQVKTGFVLTCGQALQAISRASKSK
jgi:hypothetical protein